MSNLARRETSRIFLITNYQKYCKNELSIYEFTKKQLIIKQDVVSKFCSDQIVLFFQFNKVNKTITKMAFSGSGCIFSINASWILASYFNKLITTFDRARHIVKKCIKILDSGKDYWNNPTITNFEHLLLVNRQSGSRKYCVLSILTGFIEGINNYEKNS